MRSLPMNMSKLISSLVTKLSTKVAHLFSILSLLWARIALLLILFICSLRMISSSLRKALIRRRLMIILIVTCLSLTLNCIFLTMGEKLFYPPIFENSPRWVLIDGECVGMSWDAQETDATD